jgi:cytochrome c oxidase subunit II
MKKIIIALGLLLVLINACSPAESQDTVKARKIIEYHKSKFDNLQLSGKIVEGVREIEVKAMQYSWEPENIVVQKGEDIRFIVGNSDVPHGFELEGIQIPGWDPDTIIKKGDKKIIELNAKDAGEWEIKCTVYCGPGHGGMAGRFIVRE